MFTSYFYTTCDLDIDLSTILEEQGHNDKNTILATEEHVYVGEHMVPIIVSSPDGSVLSPYHVIIVSHTQNDNEDDPPSDEDSDLGTWVLMI